MLEGAPDADLNLIPDACDIAAGRLADCDSNGIADIAEWIALGGDATGNYRLPACFVPTPDIYADGVVDAVDLAVVLSRWNWVGTPADLNNDGFVGGEDLAILLSAWGPFGLCGDGFADPGENCCNCPSDVHCGDGFDCYYGECVACPSGECPKGEDLCEVLYGPQPLFPYGTADVCYGQNPYGFWCAAGLLGNTRAGGFSMNVLSVDIAAPSAAIASFGLLAFTAIPLRSRRRTATPAQR